jgi:phosphoribosyl 1,2-cyclic phosphodiesterase/CheY-like chemotaxis protein
MSSKRLFYVVDDRIEIVETFVAMLSSAGHDASGSTSVHHALQDIIRLKPDCVLVDLMMPELDGIAFCQEIRRHPGLDRTKFVVVSGKPYDFDRRQAAAVGAAGYITKPVRLDFVQHLEKMLADRAELRFWGVRGTLPVPGSRALRYGGNTSCVTLSLENDRLFILDGGTGIKELSNHLLARKGRISAKIFITHPHWDHINALPYFTPFYMQGNEFEVLGAVHGELTMADLFGAQMSGVYFPVTTREFAARISFRDLREQEFEIDGVAVRTMLLCHPGICLGYRFTVQGKSVCYVTDQELFPPSRPEHDPQYVDRLTDFVRDADVLITDTTYSDEEYRSKIGWGHSCISAAATLADRAGVKELCLFHHDPDQTDADIDRKLASTQELLRELHSPTICRAPAEGDTILL